MSGLFIISCLWVLRAAEDSKTEDHFEQK